MMAHAADDRSLIFTKLAPVLNVRDLAAERAFYEGLGLPVIYQGDEYPDFIALGTQTLDFGIQTAKATPPLKPGSASTPRPSWTDLLVGCRRRAGRQRGSARWG